VLGKKPDLQFVLSKHVSDQEIIRAAVAALTGFPNSLPSFLDDVFVSMTGTSSTPQAAGWSASQFSNVAWVGDSLQFFFVLRLMVFFTNLLHCLRGTFAHFLSALCDFPSGLASLLAGLFGRISYFFSSLLGTFGSRLADGLGRNPGGCLTAEAGTEAEPSR
jgi:hypothetical protein